MNILNRNILPSILEQLQFKEFAIITGPRQCGKTSLLRLVEDHLHKSGETVVYLTMEDPAILKRLNEHPENLLSVLPQTDQKIYVFIDEIQYLNDPTNFLKYNFDLHWETIKIVCTGSSAFYIDQNFKDSLAGRKQIFKLFTLSFDEFLYFKTGDNSLKSEWLEMKKRPEYLSPKQAKIRQLFDEYLTYGGYPEVVLASSVERKKSLLSELSQAFLRRDVLESNVRDEEKFFILTRLLAAQSGGLVNVNQLANTLQSSVTAVENYIHIFRKTFHIHLVRPFFSNITKELTKMPKVYFNDLGMRNILLKQFSDVESRFDKGELLENYVFIRLRDTYSTDDIQYWRTADGNEVDFVVSTEFQKGFAIECKFDEKAFSRSKYKKFEDSYPNFPLSVKSYQTVNFGASILLI
ncbi:MAG: ATP-binding protein [Bacteroidota bacterium]|nr:ATP-binding protein [Bacteroidota bacterium]